MRMNPSELIENEMGRRMLMQIEQNMVTGKTLEHLAGDVLKTPSKAGGKALPPGETAAKGKDAKDGAAKDGAPKDGAAKSGAAKDKGKAEEAQAAE